eukprot:CAMPEP_0170515996 /NCGR_PEP_ID=MMETSP0209-20121228/2356_1 /TAXON_ID=665100 ORGANISM="Litonotus pictus, Strain P1" /NCGR_SAMPLE_ID=MMETSP0209 /ASSEMBLY_ACC=CAM_ASM_000301 /LENGTH=534 /DNA_ID=CAMNT_0010800741 /DNA_START=169 /DNA_END=1773 /DNA_ORIENTATION=+
MSKALSWADLLENGHCAGLLSGLGSLHSNLKGHVSSIGEDAIEALGALKLGDADVCLGSFTADVMSSSNAMSMNGCSNFPMNSGKYFLAGLFIQNVPCDPASDVDICLMYADDTLGIVFNGELFACLADLDPELAPVADAVSHLDNFALAYSTDKMSMSKIEVCYWDFHSNGGKGKFNCTSKYSQPVNLYFMAEIGFDLPKVLGHDISNIFALDIEAQFGVNFGFDAAGTAVDKGKELLHKATTNYSDFKDMAKDILNSRPSFVIEITGILTINLSDLTHGFLPNKAFDLSETNLVVATESMPYSFSKCYNPSLPAGAYVYIEPIPDGALGDIIKFIETILRFFEGKHGPPSPSKIVVFAQEHAFGIHIDLGGGLDLSCNWIRGKSHGICKYISDFVMFLYDAAKWVVKKIEHFFDDVGHLLVDGIHDLEEIGDDVKDVIDKAYDDIKDEVEKEAKKLEKDAEDLLKDADHIADEVVHKFGHAIDAAVGEVEKGVKAAVHVVKHVVHDVVHVADDVAHDVAHAAHDVWHDITSW